MDLMTVADEFMLALTAWRENRGGQSEGMRSVMNVILNRATLYHTSPYTECIKPWQFSSITAKNDPQLASYPSATDIEFNEALQLAFQASEGTLGDITGGATFYYSLSMQTPPSWAAEMIKTVEIAGQVFLK